MVGARVELEGFESGPLGVALGFPSDSLYPKLAGPGIYDPYGHSFRWLLNFSGSPASPPRFKPDDPTAHSHSGSWFGRLGYGNWYARGAHYPSDGIGGFARLSGNLGTPAVELRIDDSVSYYQTTYQVKILIGINGELTVTEFWYDSRYVSEDEDAEEGERTIYGQLPIKDAWFEAQILRTGAWFIKQNGATVLSGTVPRKMNVDGLECSFYAYTPGEFLGPSGSIDIDDVYGFNGVFRPDPEISGQLEQTRARILPS